MYKYRLTNQYDRYTINRISYNRCTSIDNHMSMLDKLSPGYLTIYVLE